MNNKLREIMSIKEVGILIPFLAMILFFGILSPQFFSGNNLNAVFRGLAYLGIVAVGQTLVILVGEVDVSVGSVAGLGAILGTWFAARFEWNVWLSMLLAVLLCGVIGLINGTLIVKFKIPAFVGTIGMLYVAKGLVMIISKGYPVYPLPKLMNDIGNWKPFGTSAAFVLFIALVIVFGIILTKTSYGRYLYATGDNIQVARLSGINVNLVKISTFVILSMLAGVAGILVSCQLQTGSPTTGSGWELQVIAATAVGGISLLGGSGSMIGTLIGILILNFLSNGLVLLGLDTHWQTVVIGSVMIIAVLVDMIRRNKKIKA